MDRVGKQFAKIGKEIAIAVKAGGSSLEGNPALRRVVGLSLALATASFAGLWFTLAIVLDHNARFGWRPLDWLVDLLGAFVALLLTWFLFPAVVTLVMGFFLDRIAGAVEALDYPGSGPARHAPIAETTKASLRLMVFAVILNVLALPVYVLAPGMNFFVFLGLNGYLFGREYFEVVALRRLDPTAARTARHRFTGRVFLGGQSYGGRQASILAAGEPGLADALLLLSYPLHPPGRRDAPRTAHFPELRTPALFVHGSVDPFGTLDEVETARRLIPARTELVPIEGAGHALFRGRAPAVAQAIAAAFLDFIAKAPSRPPGSASQIY